RVGTELGEHGLDALAIEIDTVPDFHLHDGVAAVDVAPHLAPQRAEVLAGIVVAAGRVDEHARVGLDAMPLGEQPEEGLAGDLRDGVPHGHVDRADGNGALAVAAGLLVAHERGPYAIGIEVHPGVVEQRVRISGEESRREPLANETTLPVAPIRVESVADDAPSVAHD